MHYDRYFNYSAMAQIVAEPFEDRIIAVNQEACKLLRMDAQEAVSQTLSGLFCLCLPELIVFTQEVYDRGKAWSDRLKLGVSETAVEVSARAAEAGGEHYLYLTIQEVAEVDKHRKNSDADLHYQSGIGHWGQVARVFQEFERENQLLLDAAGEGIYGVDAHGNTTFVNPAAQRILGYQDTELAGRNMHTLVHHSHSDGSHFHSEQCPIYAAFKEGTVQTVEDDVFWNKEGKPVDVEYTSTPIMERGTIMGAVVIFRDITQKKADKKRLLEALKQVEDLKNRLELENAYLQEEINSEFNHHQIIGVSQAIQTVLQQINLVAPTEATVLVHGESGTGKELIARAIHEESQRSHRSLIRVNCAAIPQDLFESEFFGHAKGAFTGATHDRAGRFELADGGTIFLDEVGEIPLHLQSKLLRVLQEQQIERVGEARTRDVNVRVIAATNRDLKLMVEQGAFREDLYFRLNVFPIYSVPLRQRIDDVPMLAQHFVEKSCARIGKRPLQISIGEMNRLRSYDWPGNIRELENVIERQAILSQGASIHFGVLENSGGSREVSAPSIPEGSQILTESELRNFEKNNYIKALRQCQGVVFGAQGAAKLMDVKPTTLKSRLEKHDIRLADFRQT